MLTTSPDILSTTEPEEPEREATDRRKPALVVGTRGSALALWQTNWVLDRLHTQTPQARYVVETIKTHGDRTQGSAVPLTQLGDKGIFVAELERALLDGEMDVVIQPMQDRALVEAERRATIDAAVHSLKDLPSVLTTGLTLAAVTPREDARDVLVSRSGRRFAELPEGAVVATSSLRRRAQALHLRPDLRIVDIRGNVDTRLRKALAEDGPDAILLAAAGLHRLGLEGHITEYLPVEMMVPAVGQGALAIEVRASDQRARRLMHRLDSLATRRCITAERAVLATLGGGCQVPIGAHATIAADGATLRLIAIVATPDGKRLLRVEREGAVQRPVALGRQVARELMRQGAGEILRAVLGRP